LTVELHTLDLICCRLVKLGNSIPRLRLAPLTKKGDGDLLGLAQR
jgi:hypothetical protein